MDDVLRIGFLLFPHVTQLDLVGPAQVFATVPGTALHFVWKDWEHVPTDCGMGLRPSATFDTCPQVDVLCVPGGPGQGRWMGDGDVLRWLHRQGTGAKWITSVCSGSLLLGAAGLLKGYRAASHWNYRAYLETFGAIADTARVVRDRNRITGGGVTAGIDLALTVVAEALGPEQAKLAQLVLEYAPQPPFDCGRPELAGDDLVRQARERLEGQRKLAEQSAS